MGLSKKYDEKYEWVNRMDDGLKAVAHNFTYFVASCVCLFRGHDYHKYTLTVCDRCMRIHP
jgi:hypothetical protein